MGKGENTGYQPFFFSQQCLKKKKRVQMIKHNQQRKLFHFYTPVEDGTYYGITRGGRAGGVQFFVRSISPKLLYLGL